MIPSEIVVMKHMIDSSLIEVEHKIDGAEIISAEIHGQMWRG